MKKNRIITLVSLTLVLLLSNIISALDCPRGIENDPYPGVCGLYTDADTDKVCDLSQETKIVPQTTTAIKTTSPSIVKGRDYYLLHISLALIPLYIISLFLSIKNIISKVTHRKIWNILLLISFLGVGISGIILVLRITYGIDISFIPDLLFWHVETGIVMSLISIFHIIWHFPYYKAILRK